MFSTGSRNLDGLLGGAGLPARAFSVVYGEVATGRTNFGLSACRAAIEAGRTAVLIDCEASGNQLEDVPPGQFSTLAPTTLVDALGAALNCVMLKDYQLVVLDSPNLLTSGAGGPAGAARVLTNWLPRLRQRLQDVSYSSVLITWQAHRGSGDRETGPIALRSMSSVNLRLQKVPTTGETLVTVTKDRRGEEDRPSCLIRWRGRGMLEDVRVVNDAIDRGAIPSRFDRDLGL